METPLYEASMRRSHLTQMKTMVYVFIPTRLRIQMTTVVLVYITLFILFTKTRVRGHNMKGIIIHFTFRFQQFSFTTEQQFHITHIKHI